MSVSGGDPRQVWSEVDGWFAGLIASDDADLDGALARSEAAGLPPIAVAPLQGRMLRVLALSVQARRVLEVGTLGGYSTLHLLRGLQPVGTVTTLEIDPHHAEVARAYFAAAGVAERVDLRVGQALALLPQVAAEGEAPFDLAFIDANKPDNAAYFDWALRLVRPGGLIVVDNVVRSGAVLDMHGDANVQGVRRLAERVVAEPRVVATVLQTVGVKGYDGLLVASVLP